MSMQSAIWIPFISFEEFPLHGKKGSKDSSGAQMRVRVRAKQSAHRSGAEGGLLGVLLAGSKRNPREEQDKSFLTQTRVWGTHPTPVPGHARRRNGDGGPSGHGATGATEQMHHEQESSGRFQGACRVWSRAGSRVYVGP